MSSTEALQSLEFVGGGVRVSDSYSLERIDLPSLTTIGGELVVEHLPRLATLEGFSALDEVGGDVTLRELDELTVARLPRWSYIGGALRIEANALLDSVLEPGTLFEIGSYLEISQSPRLRRVDGFGALRWLRDDVYIVADDWDPSPQSPWEPPSTTPAPEFGAIGSFVVWGTRSLEEVTGFEQIRATESLRIGSNARLRHVVGFATLVSHGAEHGDVWIQDNPELVELPALTGTIHQLRLENNDSLLDVTDLQGVALRTLHVDGNAGLRSLVGLELADDWRDVSITDNDALETLDGIGIAPAGAWWGSGLRILRNGSLRDVSALEAMVINPPAQAIIAFNPRLPQTQAASLAERLGTQEGKAAGNLGWEPPTVCPWQDQICDELSTYGVALCPVGTDGMDCGG